MGAVDLRRFSGPQPLAQAAAADWLREITSLRSTKSIFSVALSGGRIAREFCSALDAQIKSQRATLEGVHFFWSDERCVPPDDPESNFRLANETLLIPLRISSEQIHRIRGELLPLEAAELAEAELRQVNSRSRPTTPELDLVLLGMGEDGHVASLFPGESEEEMAGAAMFRPVKAVKPPPFRITMGYAVLAAARQTWVLASGQGKQQAFQNSLVPGGRTPLGRVIQLRHETRIYSDIADE
jgi:6-phosphogluconolactonase